MKNLIYIITIIFTSLKSYSQELPKGFEEQVKKEYNSISQEVKINELKQNFDEYFNNRKQEYIRKQELHSSSFSNRSINHLCDNGTFESGDINLSDWEFYWGGNNGASSGTNRVNTGSFNSGGPHNTQVHHQVQSIGPDPYFSALNKVYSFPTGNTKSLRLGNANNGRGLESIAKVITITPSNSILTFSYAMVMDNPTGHGSALPFFEVNLIDANNPSINYNNLINLGNNSNRISSDNPLLTPNDSTALRRWKDWQCVTSDLSSLIGKTIKIEFVNRDCWAGSHFGYTYIDNLCISCDGANGNEGSINFNQGQSDDCEIPGKICVDYTLPNGNNPSIDIELEIIQNGITVNTINSPTLTSGSSFCFNLNSTNTNGLNSSLSGFDFKITGKPKLGTFLLTPKIIGNSVNGVEQGNNNDYDIFCPPNFDCCKTPLDIWNYYGTPNPLSVQNTNINGTKLSYAEEVFELHRDAAIPITELKVNITDIQFEYNYNQCAECINNPALWGSIYSADNTIGNAPNILTQNPISNLNSIVNNISNGVNTREVIWQNPNGALLKNGDTFKVGYILPPTSEIPCCATKVKICTKISWKDANCNVCEIDTCSEIELKEKITSLKINSKVNGCCERTLTANSDVSATYLWNTGATSKSINITQNGTYTVTARTGSSSLSKTIIVSDIPSGNFPVLDHSSRFDPSGNTTGIHNKFYIFDSQKSLTANNAYNTTNYKLLIFNRWGQVIREIKDESCNGFKNWSIQWDGKDKFGNLVQSGTYEWRFFVQNCKYKNDTQVSFRTGFEKCGCKKRFLGICVNWNYCPKVEKVIVGHVNVLR